MLNQYGRFDVTVETKGYGGMIAIPRAVRHAVSLCVAALVDDDQKEKLRLGMTRTMCTNIPWALIITMHLLFSGQFYQNLPPLR